MKKIHFLVIGLNPSIDNYLHCKNLKVNEKNLIDESQLIPGGKGFNVAACLAKQSEFVSILGFVGEQELDLFSSSLLLQKVKKLFIPIRGNTRINYKVIDDSSGDCTELNLAGFKITKEKINGLLALIEKNIEQYNLVSISGSIPPGVPPNFYARLIKLFKKYDVRCGLDSSGRELNYGVEALPDVLKINVHEMGELVGKELKTINQIVKATESLCHKGIQLVVVSMGRHGAIANNGSEVWQAIPPTTNVVNPIGAGDAMMAGCLFEYACKSPLKTLIKNATALATASVANMNLKDIKIHKVKEISRFIHLNQIQ